MPRKKWTLDRAAFDSFLLWLDESRDEAGRKYEKIREKLIKFFECKQCFSPEELVDETIDRVVKRIAQGEQILSSDPSAYFFGVAKYVALEHFRRQVRRAKSIHLLPSGYASQEPSATFDRRLTCARECLNQLEPEEASLITEYYRGV